MTLAECIDHAINTGSEKDAIAAIASCEDLDEVEKTLNSLNDSKHPEPTATLVKKLIERLQIQRSKLSQPEKTPRERAESAQAFLKDLKIGEKVTRKKGSDDSSSGGTSGGQI